MTRFFCDKCGVEAQQEGNLTLYVKHGRCGVRHIYTTCSPTCSLDMVEQSFRGMRRALATYGEATHPAPLGEAHPLPVEVDP